MCDVAPYYVVVDANIWIAERLAFSPHLADALLGLSSRKGCERACPLAFVGYYLVHLAIHEAFSVAMMFSHALTKSDHRSGSAITWISLGS
jgi:hypothetical protein